MFMVQIAVWIIIFALISWRIQSAVRAGCAGPVVAGAILTAAFIIAFNKLW